MASVLGIDAAWTKKEPSEVALLEGSPGGWRCVVVAPRYDSFLSLAEASTPRAPRRYWVTPISG